MRAVNELRGHVSVKRACEALGFARASVRSSAWWCV